MVCFLFTADFFCIDRPIALFWAASLNKVPHGGWVPLLIGIILLVHLFLNAIESHLSIVS
jgi:K+ transporter